MSIINANQLQKLGASKEDSLKYVDHLNDTMVKYNINTKQRICHFLSQIFVESGSLTKVKESLYYSTPERLMEIWPTRFPTKASALPYIKSTAKLAPKVYSNRMGNGDEKSGDAAAFIGRGLKQLTGRDNYTNCGNSLGIDFTRSPELLEQPKYACLSAGWFWNTNKLNNKADIGGYDQVDEITKVVNGGTIGLKDRQAFYKKAELIF